MMLFCQCFARRVKFHWLKASNSLLAEHRFTGPQRVHKRSSTCCVRQVGYGPILLQKLAAMDLAAGPFVEPRFEALALTHFTQL
ncbi:hypothetical protein BST67_09855 [Bradyrhizobium canariense]|nr:hypothetical protein BST67_09855 [Bradyrhizobium canariense]